jgi:hypothetical protein
MTRIISSKRSVALLVALCVLCVSVLIVPVHAVAGEEVMIPAIQAMCSQLMGLGLEASGGNDALTALADNIAQLPEMASYIVQQGTDYFVKAVKMGSAIFMPLAMITAVRARIFAKGDYSALSPIVSDTNFGVYSGNVQVSYTANGTTYTKTYKPGNFTGKYSLVCVVVANRSTYLDSNVYMATYDATSYNNGFFGPNTSGIYWRLLFQACLTSVSDNVTMINGEGISDAVDAIVSISDSTALVETESSNYTLGVIAPYDTSISDGYATWASGAISVPNSETGEDDTYYPVGVSSTLDGTLGLTQEQIWTGVTDISTDTSDIATNVQSMKGTLSQVLESVDSIADVFTTTQAVALPNTAMHFDELFTLFPFSIPKDLIDCIGFWNAGAAAPNISIPLPKVSGGFSIEKYDVPFEDIPTAAAIVAILRAGQIILFCVGLLLITRKVTKW